VLSLRAGTRYFYPAMVASGTGRKKEKKNLVQKSSQYNIRAFCGTRNRNLVFMGVSSSRNSRRSPPYKEKVLAKYLIARNNFLNTRNLIESKGYINSH
jgi:hypothetical protein